jgi:hypothetical protein
VVEKMRMGANASAKAKVSGERHAGHDSGRKSSCAGVEASISHRVTRATTSKRIVIEFDSSVLGCSMELPIRRTAPRQSPKTSPPLCLNREKALPPKTLWTNRELSWRKSCLERLKVSYTEVGFVYAGEVLGRAVK